MDTLELVNYVKRQFGDESGVQVTDEDILRWINAAQREAVLYNESLLKTTTTMNLVTGQQAYAFPADLFILRSLRIKFNDWVSYAYVEGKNLQDFDKMISGWDGQAFGTGKSFIYTTYDRQIFLFPPPDQDVTDGLKILYSASPVDIDDVSDPLSLPEPYHNAILKYCMGEATTMDEDLEASAVHQTRFLSDIRLLSYQDEYGAQETYPTISVRPEDAW
jgi:hypothetical protein